MSSGPLLLTKHNDPLLPAGLPGVLPLPLQHASHTMTRLLEVRQV